MLIFTRREDAQEETTEPQAEESGPEETGSEKPMTGDNVISTGESEEKREQQEIAINKTDEVVCQSLVFVLNYKRENHSS